MDRLELSKQLAEYILDSESEDFYENLEDLHLTKNEIKLVNEFGDDDIDMDDRLELIFKKLSDKHIFATAICYSFNIK